MQFEDIALKKRTEISDKKWSEFGSENWVQNLVQTDWGKSTRRYRWKQLYKLFYGYVSTRNEVNAMRVARVQLGWLIGLVVVGWELLCSHCWEKYSMTSKPRRAQKEGFIAVVSRAKSLVKFNHENCIVKTQESQWKIWCEGHVVSDAFRCHNDFREVVATFKFHLV